MADAEIRAKSFKGAGPVDTDLRTVLHGLVTTDWISTAIARGFGWMTDVGGGTGPITGGGAGTVFDAEQPELAIDIPTGFIFVPLSASIQIEHAVDLTDAQVTEAEIFIDRTQTMGVSSTTGTRETPINMRSDIVGGCPCDVISAVTGDLSTGTPVISQVLARLQIEKEVVTAVDEFYIQTRVDYEPESPLLIAGPACFMLWWAGAAAQAGYAQATFLAIPEALATTLS